MHELSLMEGVLGIVMEAQREHGFRKVLRIALERGALSSAEPEALRFCFDVVMAGSVAEGALLELLEVPALGVCGGCGETVEVSARAELCRTCGGVVGEITQGTDLRIKDLEVE